MPAWPWLALALLWFAAGAIRPWLEPDEARYAEIPREMAASGDWLTPRLNGLLYFEKPPLQYWATAAAYDAFGVSPFTSRLFVLLTGLLATWCAWRLARRVTAAVSLAPFGAAALVCSPYFLLSSQLNLLDGAFAALLALTATCFVEAQLADRMRTARAWMWAAWVALALAVLQKGIAALVVTGGALVFYSLIARDFSPWKRLWLLSGLPLFLAVAGGWFVLMSRRHADFAWFFFVHEHFERFTSTIHQRSGPVWYFLPILLIALLPWLGAVWPAVREAWRAPASRGFMPGRFLLVWCAWILLFFSVSGSKLPPYILPMMPPLAALLAPALAARPWLQRWAAWLSALVLAIVASAVTVLAARAAAPAEWSPAVIACLAAAMFAIAALLVIGWRTGRGPWSQLAAVTIATALGWLALLDAHSLSPLGRTAPALASALRARIGADTTLYSVGQYRQSLTPYLGRTMQLAAYEGELEFGLRHTPLGRALTLEEFRSAWANAGDAVAVIDPEEYRTLAAEGLPGRLLARDAESIVVTRQ